MSAACNNTAKHLAALMAAILMTAIGSSVLAASKDKAAASTPAMQPVEPTPPAIPEAAQQQFAEAMRQVQAGQTEQASLMLQELAVRYPTSSTPLVNLGLLEQKANRHESAVQYFKRALERNHDLAIAQAGLGLSYRQLGRMQEAEQAYQAAIQTDASYAPAHLNLGILYDVYLNKPAQALQEYEAYQGLLKEPDAKVAGWIKDVKARAGSAAKVGSTGVQP